MTTDESNAVADGENFKAVFYPYPYNSVTLEDLIGLIEASGVSFVGAAGREKFERLSPSLRDHFIVEDN